MFRKFLSYATSGITNLIAKYAVRAFVTIPFLFALGFGLAGLTVVLIDAFGYRDAYFLLAGGFAALGVVAALAIWLKERSETERAYNRASYWDERTKLMGEWARICRELQGSDVCVRSDRRREIDELV